MFYNDFFSPLKLKNFFKEGGIAPKKSLGQNFLIDRNVVDKIIKIADLTPDDLVIEIGAGCGVLTLPIARRVNQVIAYEIDQRLTPVLQQISGKYKNVQIRVEDVLRVNRNEFKLSRHSYKLIGNLPYYIASPILCHFLSGPDKPQSIVVMVQKEVAWRICATPPQMSRISVLVQFYGQPRLITKVSKNSFWPTPKVASALVKIELSPKRYRVGEERSFRELVKAGFANKRKTLLNNLYQKYQGNKEDWARLFLEAGLRDTVRAQELDIVEWIVLNSKIKESSCR